MLEASLTFASLPTYRSKNIAAIGVTYSWLKRRSAWANPVSPGFTLVTPTSPLSFIMCRAKIFSATVIARVFVEQDPVEEDFWRVPHPNVASFATLGWGF